MLDLDSLGFNVKVCFLNIETLFLIFYLSVYETFVLFLVTGYSSREHLQTPSSVPKTCTRQKVRSRRSMLQFCSQFRCRVKTTDSFTIRVIQS